ncbi:transposase [Gluconacetobacter diazotrophicus]|uniref:transposase n=1 Tax=Gluconacetobacter diazotrophicus TaxID=33996 RepID=UPI0009D65FA5
MPAQKRWLVERGFAWLGDYRRLDKDYEERADVSCHMIELAILRMALRRLCPVPRIGKSWV